MPRRKSFSSIMKAAARESARAQRQAAVQQRQQVREYERATKAAEKQANQEYLESRLEEVEDSNLQIANWIQDLQNILEHTLGVDDAISFDDLRVKDTFASLQIPTELSIKRQEPILQKPSSPPKWLSNIFTCLKQRHINALKKVQNHPNFGTPFTPSFGRSFTLTSAPD